MPPIKEVSKCRRIPKEKQSEGSGDSIDDENTELYDDFVKLRKLFNESQHKVFKRRLKKKIMEKLSNMHKGDCSEDSSDPELPKVDYPDPVPKIDRDKKTRGSVLNSVKKSGLGGHSSAKNKVLSKPMKKMKDSPTTTIDGIRSNPGLLKNRKSTQQTKDNKKDEKSAMTGSGKKKNENSKRDSKGMNYDLPRTSNDRGLTKNEVEAMIRMVLKQSREDGGNTEEIDDVSLGETESSLSDDELDLGKVPEMSTTPDDISGADDSSYDDALSY